MTEEFDVKIKIRKMWCWSFERTNKVSIIFKPDAMLSQLQTLSPFGGSCRDYKSYLITRPSILCVTQKRTFMPLYIVLGQQRACMPVYIGKSGDLVGWHRCLTDRQQKIELLSFSTVSSLSWVTQCCYKISYTSNYENLVNAAHKGKPGPIPTWSKKSTCNSLAISLWPEVMSSNNFSSKEENKVDNWFIFHQ